MEKSQKIFLLSNIVLIGFFIAVIFHYVCSNVLNLGHPFNTFVYLPSSEWFMFDLKTLTAASLHLTPFSKPDALVVYFPLTYIFLFPFALLKNYLLEYFIFIAVFLFFLIHQNVRGFYCKELSKMQNLQNIFILTFMTYPFLSLLNSGNLDMLLVILFAVSIYAFREKRYYKSAILFAIINSFKPFFLPFLVLFVFEKRWRELSVNLLLTFYLIVFGFFLLHGNIYIQFAGFKTNLALYQQKFLYHPFDGTSTCSSLFQALKYIAYHTHSMSTFMLVKMYNYILLAATGITVYFALRENTFWKRISLLVLYTLVFPHTVFDYKLIFLLIPIWLFVNSEEKSKLDVIYTSLFGLLLIPKKQLFFVEFSTIANPVIMLVFIGLIIWEQIFKNKKVMNKD